eukprot:CAMPEP_0180639948 /NCGR_PEP_ID=MMETSP1037_2-20121125/45393_1 /TAXON_ID=632150 /ORGANISM="Azadinium spinosum, Strain 3D9" /LENGTH=348 /DNA_ID=CAMNT_0022662103 /DNA_START=88 /DNA_END=1134 /DNA_ORIENTATION=-
MSNSRAWQRWRALEARVNAGEALVLDGGMGSQVEKRVGKEALNAAGWTSSMNLTHPEVVKGVHRDYLEAGAHIIITNTYGTNRHILAAAGLEEKLEENNRSAVRLAREALEEFRDSGEVRDVLVAGSISIHAPGDEKAKLAGEVPWPAPEAEVANYAEQARLLMDAGVDMIFIELVWNLEHGERVVQALASMPDTVPIFLGITMFNDAICMECYDVREGTGFDIQTRHAFPQSANAPPLAKALPKLTTNPNIVGVNIMHTKGFLIAQCLEAVRSAGWTGALGVYPDCGEWLRDSWISDAPANHLAENADTWKAAGARFIGGCCGYGPEHIRALSARLSMKKRNQHLLM